LPVMWDKVLSRVRRLRPRVLIAGVAVVALGLGSVFVYRLIRVRDDRITEIGKGCGVVRDASVARWLPGAKAQPEPLEPNEKVHCRWQAADPRGHKPTVLLAVWLYRRASDGPGEDDPRKLTAGMAYLELHEQPQDIDSHFYDVNGGLRDDPLIGDESMMSLMRWPSADEVIATVYFRQANAVGQLAFRGHGMRTETARAAAETLAREVVSQLGAGA